MHPQSEEFSRRAESSAHPYKGLAQAGPSRLSAWLDRLIACLMAAILLTLAYPLSLAGMHAHRAQKRQVRAAGRVMKPASVPQKKRLHRVSHIS